MDTINKNEEKRGSGIQRAILVGIELSESISYYMEELAGLAQAAGIEVAVELIQNRDRLDSATYIGSGKTD